MPATTKTILLFWILAIFGNGYAQQPRLMLPVGHVGETYLLFSKDGKKMLTNGEDGTAKIWDANSGLMLADLVGHKGFVQTAVFASNGHKIVTTSDDNTIKIWGTESGQLLHTMDGNKGKLRSVELLSNNKQLLAFYDSASISIGILWDLNSGKLLSFIRENRFKGDDGKIYSSRPLVTVSPDGRQILRTDSYKFDSIILVTVDAVSGKRKDTLEGPVPPVRSFQYSPDGKSIIALGGYYLRDTALSKPGHETTRLKRVVIVWNAINGRLLNIIELRRFDSYYNRPYYLPEEKVKLTFDSKDKNLLIINDGITIETWNWVSGKLVSSLYEQAKNNSSYRLSNDSKSVLVCDEKTIKVLDLASGKLLQSFDHESKIKGFGFNERTKILITRTENNVIYVWDTISGKLLSSLNCGEENVKSVSHSPYGKYIAIIAEDAKKESKEGVVDEDKIIKTVKLWDWDSDTVLWSLRPPHNNIATRFSPDGENLAIYTKAESYSYREPVSLDMDTDEDLDILEIWNARTGKKKSNFQGYASYVRSAVLSPDEKRIIMTYEDSTVRIWDVQKGQFISALNGHTDIVNMVQFSKEGKYIVTASNDSAARIWDANSGRLFYTLGEHEAEVYSARFSTDAKYIVTSSDDDSRIWDATTGKLLRILKGGGGNDAQFSPDGKYIVSDAKIFDTRSGELLFELDWHNGAINSNQFSNDGKYIVTTSSDETAKVWSLEYGELLYSLDDHTDEVVFAVFSEDDKKIITASLDNTIKIWDAQTGTLNKSIDLGPNTVVKDIHLKGDKLLCVSAGSETKIINFSTGERLYSFFAMDSSDYLVVDKFNRFDGTESARKLLYFTCNDEVIELDQVKDQLWTPGLAERIIKGDSINALKLSDLNICGLTPEVKEKGDKSDSFQFKIIPRRGGLGESALYLNGIEIKRYTKSQLKFNAGAYDLVIPKRELFPYFIPGQENPVTIKAWVSDNSISSRGLIIKEDKTKDSVVAPNLYAVMVGVSDYKGDELDLKYAAKDAIDISAALESASKKLFNIDNKQHVFTYNLTTSSNRYLLPEKNSIKKTLEEIGKKATANDILLIFFAGHGMMQGKSKKQFYFLTADASKSSAADAVAEVGISTAELTEWMKPANIKAQKRVLIFDACNSGQAIRDFVQLGKPDQGYNVIVARNDEKGQQIKAIEKLNNQSGLIILAASASDQDAYEMSRYSQGLLTYALLKVLKQQPEILESGKYLDVTNWLNAAKKVVGSLAEATGARQEPQFNSNNNFNIGLVDEEVRSGITLAAENPIFTRSNFQNADTKLDNLKLRNAIDKQLINAGDKAISYSADYDGADAFTLAGDYRINGDEVTASVMLVKGGADIKHRFEIKGKKTEPDTIASLMISAADEWLRKNR